MAESKESHVEMTREHRLSERLSVIGENRVRMDASRTTQVLGKATEGKVKDSVLIWESVNKR